MKPRHALVVAVLLASVFVVVPTYQAAQKRETASANYTISLDGTPGVKLRLFLVKKGDPKLAPTRESKTISVPFKASFRAAKFYAWFDTLEDGKSGNAGDRVEGTFSIDGDNGGGGFGLTLKDHVRATRGMGNL